MHQRGARGATSVSFSAVDEGLPIAYPLLDKGVPVLSSDGVQIGTVHHVVAAAEQDIFHGLVIDAPHRGHLFVDAADVASLHEHGVDLSIDSTAAMALHPPSGAAPVYDEDPSQMQGWSHWSRKLTLRKDWKRER